MDVPGRDVGVLEGGAAPHVVERLPVVVVGVLLRVVGPDPLPVLGFYLARVLGGGVRVDAALVVQESQLLAAGHALESWAADWLDGGVRGGEVGGGGSGLG